MASRIRPLRASDLLPCRLDRRSWGSEAHDDAHLRHRPSPVLARSAWDLFSRRRYRSESYRFTRLGPARGFGLFGLASDLLRLQREMGTTATFKMVKGDLRKEGYDLDQVNDPLFVMRPGSDQYEPLAKDYLEALRSGQGGF